MRFLPVVLLYLVTALFAQQPKRGPVSAKAQKSFASALKYEQHGMMQAAMNDFKKADKQDGGHCWECQKGAVECAVQTQDWHSGENMAEEMIQNAHNQDDVAVAHFEAGLVFAREGQKKHKNELLVRSNDELGKALAIVPNFPEAVFADGFVLAELGQDQAAKARFKEFLSFSATSPVERGRATRYVDDPSLARQRLAPAFIVTTMDGRQVSLDNLTGKVVLLDFWATWCGPCREALPQIKTLAKKFQGEPFVILSVSLDTDQNKWKDFVAKNGMTWPQYYDGGWTGPMATLFGVRAIPQTFTIDADGVLQDQHIGDASIEGKLRKLVAHAQQEQTTENQGTDASRTR